MSITGRKEGEEGAGPQKVGVALTDILTGLYGTVGILAALADRERTGEGQHIDVALLDVHVACLANQAMNYLVGGTAPAAMGNSHPNIVPYQDFPTSDGYMVIAVGNDEQFARLCATLGDASLGQDDRYRNNRGRVEHRAALVPQLEALTRRRTTADWVKLLEEVGVPCGPINNLEQVFADPQIVARGLKLDLPRDEAGSAPSVANPLRLSRTPVEYRSAPPTLGNDTGRVLKQWLSMPEDRIEDLREAGIV